MRIGNLTTPGVLRSLASASADSAQASERLATGLRINRASDDPSGLVAAEALKADITRIDKLVERKEIAALRLNTMDGYLGSIGDGLTDLRALSVQAANRDALSDSELEAIQTEAAGIIAGLNKTALTATFNGEQLLGGKVFGDFGLQGNLRGMSDEDLAAIDEAIQAAVDENLTARGEAGARQKALGSEVNALLVEFENTVAALSQIQDTDYASEVSNQIVARFKERASIEVLRIDRERGDQILQLLDSIRR